MNRTERTIGAALRITFAASLVVLLTACGAPATPDGDAGGGGGPANAQWGIVRPAPAEPVDGTRATVSADAVTGTDSEPSGWTLVVSRPGGFVDLGTYSSDVYPDASGTGDLTVTFTAPGGTSCSVGPDSSSVSAGGPNPGDTYAQVTYAGTEDGVPTLAFGVFSAACDGLPGASGSGTVDVYLFGVSAD